MKIPRAKSSSTLNPSLDPQFWSTNGDWCVCLRACRSVWQFAWVCILVYTSQIVASGVSYRQQRTMNRLLACSSSGMVRLRGLSLAEVCSQHGERFTCGLALDSACVSPPIRQPAHELLHKSAGNDPRVYEASNGPHAGS